MSQKTILEIYTYIQKYLAQKNTHPNYVDYYELYNLDPSSDIETLKNTSKKIRKLFHPDQKIFIDNKYGFIYDEIMNKNNELFNIIANEKNKSIYDNDLKKQKEYFERNNKNENKQTFTTDEILKILERITETAIYKYSFSVGFKSLDATTEGNYKKVTRENDCRKLISQIGVENTKKAIQSINTKNTFEDNIFDFYNSIIDKPGLKEKTLPFFNACKETAKKYGSPQLAQAVNNFLGQKATKFFTNDHGVRTDLEEANYSKEDIAIFIYSYLHRNGYDFATIQNITETEKIFAFSEEIEKSIQKSR